MCAGPLDFPKIEMLDRSGAGEMEVPMSRIRILTLCAFGAAAFAAGAFGGRAEAASPSFNCAKASNRAEELICGDRELASMDVEATRLFRLVRDHARRPPAEKKALNEDRARWQKVRDECWIADDVRNCILTSYAVRIHSLREKHAEARTSDAKGITRGPFDLRCKNLKQPLKATFIHGDPPVSAVQLPDSVHVGIGSGRRFIERGTDGEMAFWTKGEDAFIKLPDGTSYNCVMKR
jgi:uncharacterized protein